MVLNKWLGPAKKARLGNIKTFAAEAGLSPEELAKRLGVSNMTVRRWMKRPPGEALPSIYEGALRDTVYQLVVEGILPPDSHSFRMATKSSRDLPLVAALKGLGFNFLPGGIPGFAPDRLMVGLSQIGARASHKTEVDRNHKKIRSFSRMSLEWKERIGALMRVIRSQELTSVDKLVAYGALFYLLCPFDLIPDNIPVFGLMDDFCVLGLATAYYAQKFGKMI